MRRGQRWTVVAAATSVVLAACSSSSAGVHNANSPGGGTAAAAAGHTAVTLQLDATKPTTKVIGPKGGAISVTAADGTTFTLTVPPKALLTDTPISATPATLKGPSFPTHTVVFGPTGQFFYADATLSIEPPAPIDPKRQFLYTLPDDASWLTPAEPVRTSKGIDLVVRHFTGFGVADASPEQAASIEQKAADAAAEISGEAAALLGKERQAQLLGGEGDPDLGAKLSELFDRYEKEVVEPRVANAGSSCEAATTAATTVLGFERQRQLLGIADDSSTSTAMDRLGKLLDASPNPCEEEAKKKCKAAKDPSILLRYWLGHERQLQLLGITDGSGGVPPDAEEKARKICNPGYTASGGMSELSLSGNVPDVSKPFTLEATFTGGSGTFVYTPNDDRSGTITVSGGGNGATITGTGTYTISGKAGEALYIKQTVHACVDVSGVCRDDTFVVTLTPET